MKKLFFCLCFTVLIFTPFAIIQAQQKNVDSFVFTKTLQQGSRGEEVRRLQEFLKQYPDIYPEGMVTAYFGPYTKNAVKRFQKKEGISIVGIVGPLTWQDPLF